MPEHISRRMAARRAGIDEKTIRRHIDSGALTAALLPNGKLDAEKVAHLLPRIVTKGAVAPAALSAARTRRLRVQVRRLADEVADLGTGSITPADAAALMEEQAAIIGRNLRTIPAAAAALAGRPVREVLPALKEIVHAALDAAGEDDSEDDWWNDPAEAPVVDLDQLAPNALLARRIDLTAQKLEIEHALSRGELVSVEALVAEFEERHSVTKSLLMALPGRVAQLIESATAAEVEALVSSEVEGALFALLDRPADG